MKNNCKNAKKSSLKQNDTLDIFLAVNGCCYGIENQPNKEDYQKLCGQEFQQLISDSAKV
jgi:hypothetical protein